jgi:hypothetical protein
MPRPAARTWRLAALPDGTTPDHGAYTFYVGPLDHVPDGDTKRFLHIPEHPNRDAEGRPAHPEQAAWVEATLKAHRIAAPALWWSHWAFATDAEATRFEALLETLGAVAAPS